MSAGKLVIGGSRFQKEQSKSLSVEQFEYEAHSYLSVQKAGSASFERLMSSRRYAQQSLQPLRPMTASPRSHHFVIIVQRTEPRLLLVEL